MRHFARPALIGLALVPLMISCDCDGLDDFSAQGEIVPAVLDLGPVLDGEECVAQLSIVNNGGSELSIQGAELRDLSGEYTISQVVSSVGIGGEETLEVNYTAVGTAGDRQTAVVVLMTNDPDDEGEISATITAIATDQAGAIARLRCPNDDASVYADCSGDLSFGAVNIQDPVVPIDQRAGFTREIKVVNIGNAPMQLTAALMNDGNPDFVVSGVQQGNILVDLPITLEAGSGSCGQLNADPNSEAIITLFYSPTALGADADTLLVLTDALEGATLELPVTGVGSDIGILLTPPTVSFGTVAEGETVTHDVNVSNLGTNDAPVNTTCVDLDGDEVCDFDCTGGEPGLDGALNCEVFRTDDDMTHEGKGYILSPTDAVAGGEDERIVQLTWSPVAGNSTIPATATLRFETAILNARVWTARIIGGNAGNLTLDGLGNECASGLCVPATGTPGDVSDWAGEIEFRLANDGDATLSITGFAWEGPPTIADDYTLLLGDTEVDMANPGVDLGPGASETFTVVYLNDDASGADAINLVITHTGINLIDTVGITVTPPSE